MSKYVYLVAKTIFCYTIANWKKIKHFFFARVIDNTYSYIDTNLSCDFELSDPLLLMNFSIA